MQKQVSRYVLLLNYSYYYYYYYLINCYKSCL